MIRAQVSRGYSRAMDQGGRTVRGHWMAPVNAARCRVTHLVGLLTLVASLLLLVVVGSLTDRAAAATAPGTAAAVPTFRVNATSSIFRDGNQRFVRVKQLRIEGASVGSIRATCARCGHVAGSRAVTKRLNATTKVFLNVDWLLTAGRSITVTAPATSSRLGRFIRIGPRSLSRPKMVVKESGCLSKAGRLRTCPGTARPTVTTTPTPQPEIVPPPVTPPPPPPLPPPPAPPPPPPPPDTTPPDTIMDRAFRGTYTTLPPSIDSHSTEPVSRFEIQFDGRPWCVCPQPEGFTSYGSHTYSIRAVDLAGNVDPTPASTSWTYLRSDPARCDITQPLSATGGTRREFSFINESGGMAYVSWINFEGAMVRYADMSPSTTFPINTNVGHAWVVTDVTGRCVGYTVIDAATASYTIASGT